MARAKGTIYIYSRQPDQTIREFQAETRLDVIANRPFVFVWMIPSVTLQPAVVRKMATVTRKMAFIYRVRGIQWFYNPGSRPICVFC